MVESDSNIKWKVIGDEMIIAAILLLYTFSLFCWIPLDSYMKLVNRPLLKGRWVRFLCIHCASYNENEIKVDGGRGLISSKKNRETVAKSVLALEISNLIYTAIVVALEIIYYTTGNGITRIVSAILLGISIVYTISLFFFGNHLLNKEERRQWEKKYRELVNNGIKSNISISDATNNLMQGERVYFDIYNISFAIEPYRPDKDKRARWQLTDVTHKKIIAVDWDIAKITDRVVINAKPLRELLPYCKIELRN